MDSPDARRRSPSTASIPSVQSITPLPLSQLLLVLYMQISEPVTAHVILPFIVQLLSETGITEGDITKVGYYTGFVESLFFIMEALTTLQWGRIADKIGRRPVMLLGLLGSTISAISFGLSHSFKAIVISRGLAGALNGNNGVGKCMLGEITNETNRAKGYGALSLTWALGNAIGPLLGGLLQHPYERFGGIFKLTSFWKQNPYFLPCSVAALVPLSAFILAFFFLDETLPLIDGTYSTPSAFREQSESQEPSIFMEISLSSPEETSPLLHDIQLQQSVSSILTYRVIIAVANYALLALVDICFYVLLTLFLSTPIQKGGLGFSSSLAGTCIAAFGIADGVASVVFFPFLIRKLGPKRMATAVHIAFFGVYGMFILTTLLVQQQGEIGPLTWICFVLHVLLATATPMGYGTIGLYITASAPTQFTLGAINGLAQTTGAIMRCVGPPCATALFAVSIRHKILSGNFCYIIMAFLAIIAALTTLLLPDVPWSAEDPTYQIARHSNHDNTIVDYAR